ncbi:biotin-dependent carboxyltransferase family protein [Paraburkholderia sp. EG287A]|uniref:biotin-dependent carboxyltransferase family protein n=1 Tax=Paraburkholderia sp. EG287A TaxID=3237012 RepID=UPI0034D36848
MTLRLINPGLLATVQDGGRYGHQHLGVGPSGTMDWAGLWLSNILVGNDRDAAAFEFTGAQGEIEFLADTLIAICGRALRARERILPAYRPLAVAAGTRLKLVEGVGPFRSYLAVAGGLIAPRVLGSASMSTATTLGAFQRTGLRRASTFETGSPSDWAVAWLRALMRNGGSPDRWSVQPVTYYRHQQKSTIHVIRDTRGHCADDVWRRFLHEEYAISIQSSRMGFRLNGARLPAGRSDIESHGVGTGTIQLPPGGEPIILMADRQTTGGYPTLGHVATVDLPLLAAAWPKDVLRFREISVEVAQAELEAMQTALQRRAWAVRARKPTR